MQSPFTCYPAGDLARWAQGPCGFWDLAGVLGLGGTTALGATMKGSTSTFDREAFASANSQGDDLPRFTGRLRPAVEAVAALRWPVRRKLLAGFLCGASLLVAMGVLSLVAMDQMDGRRTEYEQAQQKTALARQMLYDVTAQSHYRAMALTLQSRPTLQKASTDRELTDPAHYEDSLAEAREDFAGKFDALQDLDTEDQAMFRGLGDANRQYRQSSARVSQLYADGDWHRAMVAHIRREHTDSHDVEDLLGAYVKAAVRDMAAAGQAYESSNQLHTLTVLGFSALSVLAAMTLGFIFSWAFILPVRQVQGALGELSMGRFPDPVVVRNRDEFGLLARDLNTTSDRLQALFAHQRDLAAELGETNASLARASEAKSNFLASVSHELRTPLNAVLGFTEALLAGVDGPLNDEQKTSLGWVQRGGSHLLSLINELLDMARVEAGRLTFAPERFSPVDTVRSVIEEHRPLADTKGIGLAYRDEGAPSVVVHDPQRVRQILSNLLGNAVKLTAVGEVEVILSQVDNGLRVAVRDPGPGVPEHEREAIFEEFHQAHGSEHGTGLGLSISRRLARAMGGDISVESEVGRGSTFALWVPETYTLPGASSHDPSREVPELQ